MDATPLVRARAVGDTDAVVAARTGFERRGTGRALTSALVDPGESWLNLRRIALIVFADNRHAIALCERLGFEREGVLRGFGYKRGHCVDAVKMARIRHRE